MMDSNSNIPYYQVNIEYLVALNKVIRKAQDVENKTTKEVIEIRGQLKGKNNQIAKLEHELNNLRELNATSLFEQYSKVVEENAKLTKDWNMQMHSYEELRLKYDKLDNLYLLESE